MFGFDHSDLDSFFCSFIFYIYQSAKPLVIPRAAQRRLLLRLTLLFLALQEVVLGDLKADTSYSVSVGAYTAKGDGARSKPVSVCTALPRKCTRAGLKTRSYKSKHITGNDLRDCGVTNDH